MVLSPKETISMRESQSTGENTSENIPTRESRNFFWDHFGWELCNRVFALRVYWDILGY